MSSGSGEATTRRQPFAPRSSQVSPCCTSTSASSRGRNRPIGLVGRRTRGRSRSTRVRVTTVAQRRSMPRRARAASSASISTNAEGRLGLGAAPVERHRRYDGRRELVLHEQVADLGPVAVRDHDVVALRDQVGDGLHRDLRRLDLVLGPGPPVRVRHGVAAEREQHPHGSNLVTRPLGRIAPRRRHQRQRTPRIPGPKPRASAWAPDPPASAISSVSSTPSSCAYLSTYDGIRPGAKRTHTSSSPIRRTA